MTRPFPGASPSAQVSVDGEAGESASSRGFRAAGSVVTWALGVGPPPRVFKRKESRLVKSFAIFAVRLAAGPVESQFAPLQLGSLERRGCEKPCGNLQWVERRRRESGRQRHHPALRLKAGHRGVGCARWAHSPQLGAASRGPGATTPGKARVRLLETSRPGFTCTVSAPRLKV